MMARIYLFLSALFLALLCQTPVHAAKYELIFDSDELLKAGKKAIKSGHLEKAASLFEEALKRKNLSRPDMIELRSDLCVTYMFLDRFDEAIEQCQTSIDLMPNRWETHNNLGTVFLIQGDFENAIASYERALQMKPSSKVLIFNHSIAIERAAEFKTMDETYKNPDSDDSGLNDYGFSSSAGFN